MKKMCLFTIIICMFCVVSAQSEPVVKKIRVSKKTKLTVGNRYKFKFSLWDSAEVGTGSEIWFEEKTIKLKKKTIKHYLGSVDPIGNPLNPDDFSQQLWVEVARWRKKTSSYVAIGSRSMFKVVPNALCSETVVAGSITTLNIQDDTITNIDINSAAAIADTKLATIVTPGKVEDTALSNNVVFLDNNQTITGEKAFNPLTSTVPFIVNPLNNDVVANLNAEMIDGQTLADLDSRYSLSAPPQYPRSNLITSVDGPENVGEHSAITVGTDGFPVISYYDATNGNLKVAKCDDNSCSSATSYTVDNDVGDVGQYTSIAIGVDYMPIISYYDVTSGNLKVAKCSDAACSSSTIYTVDNDVGDVGRFTSITIGTDGLPVISYYDITNGDLKVAKCSDTSCSLSSLQLVDNGVNVGQYTSITIGTDGLPIISYYDANGMDLKVAKCTAGDCSTASLWTLDSSNDVGQYTSITIGADGLPIVSYYDVSNSNLKAVQCTVADCSATLPSTTLDAAAGDVGKWTAISIASDGLPVISYYDATNFDLKVAKCSNASCNNASITTVDSTDNLGEYTSLTVGIDGLPVISYYDATNLDVKAVKCSNYFCINNWTRR